jgi:hypothetical protein
MSSPGESSPQSSGRIVRVMAHGPCELTHCILADALDGDLVITAEIERQFFEEFTLT